MPYLAVARHRAHLLQVGAQQAGAVVVAISHKNTAVGKQEEAANTAEPSLRRRAIPAPPLVVARDRAHLLQVRADLAEAVPVAHEEAAVGKPQQRSRLGEPRIREGAVDVVVLHIDASEHAAHDELSCRAS